MTNEFIILTLNVYQQIKHGKDAFLLLITDGINYVLQSKEACDVINQAEDPYQAAKVLTEQVRIITHACTRLQVNRSLGSVLDQTRQSTFSLQTQIFNSNTVESFKKKLCSSSPNSISFKVIVVYYACFLTFLYKFHASLSILYGITPLFPSPLPLWSGLGIRDLCLMLQSFGLQSLVQPIFAWPFFSF